MAHVLLRTADPQRQQKGEIERGLLANRLELHLLQPVVSVERDGGGKEGPLDQIGWQQLHGDALNADGSERRGKAELGVHAGIDIAKPLMGSMTHVELFLTSIRAPKHSCFLSTQRRLLWSTCFGGKRSRVTPTTRFHAQ